VETVGVIVTMLFAAQPITDRMPPPSNALHRAGRRWPGKATAVSQAALHRARRMPHPRGRPCL